ncbi:hypothetical protein, partial [Dubosiella newyorkensis]|uniref:hypothetical protein n=1 Tax=Dubosiella newyorkensis TaxID=1862672 RepID=UPI00272DAB60
TVEAGSWPQSLFIIALQHVSVKKKKQNKHFSEIFYVELNKIKRKHTTVFKKNQMVSQMVYRSIGSAISNTRI